MTRQKKMLIVAISGKQRTGKTFCSDELIEKHGFTRFSFAGPLKDDIRAMGFPEGAIAEKPPWMRALMQVYGQARRAVNIDHWAEQLRIELANAYAMGVSSPYGFPRIVIDDARFPNEMEMLSKFASDHPEVEFRACRMQRTGLQASDVSHAEDESETSLDYYGKWWQVFPISGGDLHGLRRAAEQMQRP